MSAGASEPAITVLLVEDSLDDVLLTRRAFRKAGIEGVLHICADGDAALEYLSDRDAIAQPRPSLVLLDWKLPKKDGLEVLSWIRKQARFQDLPVVVVSASGQQDEIQRAHTAGANAYIQKPLHVTGLREVIETLGLSGLKALLEASGK